MTLEELMQGVEPDSSQYQDREGNWNHFIDANHEHNTRDSMAWNIRELYTSYAVAEVVQPLLDEIERLRKLQRESFDLEMDAMARERDELRNQLADCETRVAEACAKYVHETKGVVGSVNMAEAILSGEWRKYLRDL